MDFKLHSDLEMHSTSEQWIKRTYNYSVLLGDVSVNNNKACEHTNTIEEVCTNIIHIRIC